MNKRKEQKALGSLPLSVHGLSSRAQDMHQRVVKFLKERVEPVEAEARTWYKNPSTKWQVFPKVLELKAAAKAQGLWNLFLPVESDPECKHGAGLTNVEYAFICEEIGKYHIAPEIFNCGAPETANIEILLKFGTPDQKQRWLQPLLNAEVKSCFAMTEPEAASSDATNIKSSIVRNGSDYIINGHKWFITGGYDPRCKICIFMGQTDPTAASHRRHSMLVFSMDTPGIKVVRPMTHLGYDDAPYGQAEILFENVRVPTSSLLLGEGRGFEVAQARLNPARIHHCLRVIGGAEKTLALMLDRVQNRVAFGAPIGAQSSIQQDIARSRIQIESCRLLVLKAAHMMDTVGNKEAAREISMVKVAGMNLGIDVAERAIMAFGAKGVSQDSPLASIFANAIALRIADGPDPVHLRSIARREGHIAKL